MSKKIKKNIDGLKRKITAQGMGRGVLFKKFALGASGLVLVAIAIFVFYNNGLNVKSATFGWLSTDWSGGASTTAVATHLSDQTGWTKFFSKDVNVDVTTTPGQASILVSASTSVATSDADFNAFTLENTYVSGGAVYMKKQDGGSCSSNTNCINGWCKANVCTYPWIPGPCANIEVYYMDTAGNPQYKNTSSACLDPQCATGLDASYPAQYSLVASNAVDFSSYPSRDACKAFGGRLPTVAELSCVYTNRNSYNADGAFLNDNYWTSTDLNATNAMIINFTNGVTGNSGKITTWFESRCIKDQ